jgi:hypothetical protein
MSRGEKIAYVIWVVLGVVVGLAWGYAARGEDPIPHDQPQDYNPNPPVPGVNAPFTPDPNPDGGVKTADDLRTFGDKAFVSVRRTPATPETTVGRLSAGCVFENASRRLMLVVEPAESASNNGIVYGGNQPPTVGGRVYCVDIWDHKLYLVDANDRAKPAVKAGLVIEVAPEAP